MRGLGVSINLFPGISQVSVLDVFVVLLLILVYRSCRAGRVGGISTGKITLMN